MTFTKGTVYSFCFIRINHMGFFIPDYSKPGPGIEKDAPEKTRFFLFFELFFSKISNLITLNFVYMLTMLPLIFGIVLSVDFKSFPFAFTGDIAGILCIVLSVFTSFPASAGFTFVLRNMQRREHAWLIRDMFKHAKKNYKDAAINGMVQILVYFLLYTAYVIYRYYIPANSMLENVGIILSAVIVLLTLIFMWMQFYVNTMIVTFKLTLRQIYVYAFMFAISKIPLNILITIICATIVFLLMIYPIVGISLSFLIAFSLLGFITVFCVYPSIEKTMMPKSDNKQTENNGETK